MIVVNVRKISRHELGRRSRPEIVVLPRATCARPAEASRNGRSRSDARSDQALGRFPGARVTHAFTHLPRSTRSACA